VQQDPRGLTEYDLGNGVTRRDYTKGQVLTGCRIFGQPVYAKRTADGDSWHLDYPVVASEMSQQAHATRIGHVTVYSEQPLPDAAIKNIRSAIDDAPAYAFANTHRIFAVDRLGETHDPAGNLRGLVEGFAMFEAGDIFVPLESLRDERAAKTVLWHETGHVVDYHAGQGARISERAEPDESYLFGDGRLVQTKDGRDVLNESDFVSAYASSSRVEDFAETHRVALEERERARGDKVDLFEQPAEHVHGFLTQDGLSPRIQQKIERVIESYRSHPA
jgi:hypothetical protein